MAKVEDSVRFCPECRGVGAKDGIKVHTYADREQLGHLYGSSRWKKGVQPMVISRDPLCKRCQKSFSEIADHIVPASEAVRQAQESGKWRFDVWAGFFLMSNLQGLCRSCHKLKTDEDKSHVGPWPDVIASFEAAPKKKWSF